jgi:hypothetical protein
MTYRGNALCLLLLSFGYAFVMATDFFCCVFLGFVFGSFLVVDC